MTTKSDIDQLAADAAIFHQVVHGDDGATVVTAGGTVPSLAKAAKDAAAPYADGAAIANAAAASATAAAAAAASASAVVTGGTGQLGGGAGKFPLGDASGNYGFGQAVPTARVHAKNAAMNTQSLILECNLGNPGGAAKSEFQSLYFKNYSASTMNDASIRAYANASLSTESNLAFLVTPGGAGPLTEVWRMSTGVLQPGTDNVINLGAAAKRVATIYAGTGTINTSDAREKTAVRGMTPDEIACAKALADEIGIFQFLASVEAKGANARRHIGMTVQRAIEVFQANGLDAMSYACICYDAWDDVIVDHPAVEYRAAVLDEQGAVIEPEQQAAEAWTEQTQFAGNRYSFRPDQLYAFIARGFAARLSAIEAALGV